MAGAASGLAVYSLNTALIVLSFWIGLQSIDHALLATLIDAQATEPTSGSLLLFIVSELASGAVATIDKVVGLPLVESAVRVNGGDALGRTFVFALNAYGLLFAAVCFRYATMPFIVLMQGGLNVPESRGSDD